MGRFPPDVVQVRALELSKFMSPVGKPDLFGDVDPRDARQGAADQSTMSHEK